MPTTPAGIDHVRTPDERFEGLPGWTFEPNYLEVDGLRVHYVDEGPPDASPVLLVHGEPTWGYLYRHMIQPLVGAGHRVVVPDLIGFGRSDKPTSPEAYTYPGMVDWLEQIVQALDLRDTTAFVQDWGGLLGLRVVAAQPDRFSHLVIANTALPVIRDLELPQLERTDEDLPVDFSDFFSWHAYSQRTAHLAIGEVVQAGTATELPDDVVAAYDAPFPDESFKAGPRQLPNLVMSDPDANEAAWNVLRAWDRPIVCAWAPEDPVLGTMDEPFRALPGARGQQHRQFDQASHFLQEDRGPELAAVINDLLGTPSDPSSGS